MGACLPEEMKAERDKSKIVNIILKARIGIFLEKLGKHLLMHTLNLCHILYIILYNEILILNL